MTEEYDKQKYIADKIQSHYKHKYGSLYHYKNKHKEESIKQKHINKRIKRRRESKFGKIYDNITERINDTLKKNNLMFRRNYFEILGCTLDELENYITGRLKQGMTFENYGEWEIDHILPISSFDFNMYNPELDKNISICFRYTNLQPLWKPENMKKSNHIYFYD